MDYHKVSNIEGGKKMLIKKDMIIADVLAAKLGAAKVFMNYGSHCLNCENISFKTVADMAAKHQVNLENLLAQLNDLPDLKDN